MFDLSRHFTLVVFFFIQPETRNSKAAKLKSFAFLSLQHSTLNEMIWKSQTGKNKKKQA